MVKCSTYNKSGVHGKNAPFTGHTKVEGKHSRYTAYTDS